MNINKKLLLSNTLEPDLISNKDVSVHIKRVQELLKWFERLAEGDANPKWLSRHAFELAYYIATNNQEVGIDFGSIEHKAFYEGVDLSDSQRALAKSVRG